MEPLAAGSHSSPDTARGGAAPTGGHDASAFAQQAGTETADVAAGPSREGGEDPLVPTIRQPYGAPQLPGGLPDRIPLGTSAGVALPEAHQQHLARLDAQARQATATEDRFRALDPRNPAHGPAIHDAAIAAYQHPDASMHSQNTAYQADRLSESTAYHRRSPLTRWASFRGPTAKTVDRAIAATENTPNAATMATVFRSDPGTIESYHRHSMTPYLQLGADRLTNSDPNYSVPSPTVVIPGPTGRPVEPRAGTEAASSHQFGSAFSTQHPAALRDQFLDRGIELLEQREANRVTVDSVPVPGQPETSPPAYTPAAPAHPGTNPPDYPGPRR